MTTRTSLAGAGLLLLMAAGCGQTQVADQESPAAAAKEAVSFVNKVWKVNQSASVAPGQLYVFLSEGTLVVASSTGMPALGKWTYADSSLTMVEEGISYQVDILKLSRDEFSIRSHNPGEPVDMELVPAEQPPPESLPR